MLRSHQNTKKYLVQKTSYYISQTTKLPKKIPVCKADLSLRCACAGQTKTAGEHLQDGCYCIFCHWWSNIFLKEFVCRYSYFVQVQSQPRMKTQGPKHNAFFLLPRQKFNKYFQNIYNINRRLKEYFRNIDKINRRGTPRWHFSRQ